MRPSALGRPLLLLLPLAFAAGLVAGLVICTFSRNYLSGELCQNPSTHTIIQSSLYSGKSSTGSRSDAGREGTTEGTSIDGLDSRSEESEVVGASSSSGQLGEDSVAHALSDEELFAKASALKSDVRSSNGKVAFMFLVRDNLPLAQLWERFFLGQDRDTFSVYVHANPNHIPDPWLLPPSFAGRYIPSKNVTWGSINVVDAERRLLANALLDPLNSHFLLLSESCIPLFSLPYVHAFLRSAPYEFVSAQERPFLPSARQDDPGPFGRGRYNKNFLPEVHVEQWRKGQQWFAISRPTALRIVSDTTYYPKFAKFCVPHCYPDEHYLPTMLQIQAPEKLAHSLTWTDWSKGGSHPASYVAADVLPQTITAMRRRGECNWTNIDPAGCPCNLFARKFEVEALPALLAQADALGII